MAIKTLLMTGSVNDAEEYWTGAKFWTSTTTTLWWVADVGYGYAYVQWPCSIPAGTTINSATLRMLPSVNSADNTTRVDLLDLFDGTLDTDRSALTAEDYVQGASGAFVAEEWAEIDVTDIVQAAMDHANYVAGSYITFRIKTAGSTEKRIYAYDELALNKAAQLVIDYDALDEDDPYTQVINALWALLELNSDFKTLVPAGNRIKFAAGNDPSPMKERISSADTPEVRIIPTADVPHLQRTTCSSSATQRIEIQVSSGDQRLHEKHNPVKWAIYRALAGWMPVLMGLTWNGKTFVKLARPQEIREGVSDQDLNRNIVGWSAVWACEVQMWFDTSDL